MKRLYEHKTLSITYSYFKEAEPITDMQRQIAAGVNPDPASNAGRGLGAFLVGFDSNSSSPSCARVPASLL